MMELVLIGVMVVLSAAMIAYSLLPKRREERETVMRRVSGKTAADLRSGAPGEQRDSAAKKVMQKVAPYAVKPVMPKSDEEMSVLRVKLANAGFRRETAPTLFLASKTILGGTVAAVTLMLAWGSGHSTGHIFGMAACLGGLAFLLPNIWLWLATKQRAEGIRHGLPDSVDLMVVSVEAGLGLDAAIQRVGREMQTVHPELSEEMTIATLETQMGVPRAEALENMARRTGVTEVKSLVAMITQAEKFGTSVAKALRNQADSIRAKRRQAAEERAQKTTVKLMLPLILFIFPAIFVVLAGPAGLRLVRTLMQNEAL